MKNLKRILSLALAGTMLIGMMVVGASAATFTDADEIEHSKAVETMAALGIIKGNAQPDGTTVFDPEGDLSRAQMAQMLATIKNKGVAPTWATKEKPTFTDVPKGAWYEAAVEYCANLGIINGYGNGTFAPTASVTATEAARMILNLMGYKFDGVGDWQLATEVQARDEALNLYASLSEVITNKPISRDNVAQMLFNALNKPLKDGGTYITASGTVGTGKYKITVKADNAAKDLEELAKTEYASFIEAYTLAREVVITPAVEADPTANPAVAAAPAVMAKLGTNFTIAETTVSGTQTVTETLAHKYLNMSQYPGILVSVNLETTGTNKGLYKTVVGSETFYTKENYSAQIGENVNVLYKGTNHASVYGVNPNRGYVVFEGTWGDFLADVYDDMDDDEAEAVDGVTAKSWNTAANLTLEDSYQVKVVDTNGDGYVDHIVGLPYKVGTVTFLSSTVITVAGALSNAKLTTVTGAEGLQRGDVVIVIDGAAAADGKAVITKPETVAGVITSVADYAAANDGKAVRINGNWYYPATSATSAAGAMASNKILTLVNGYYVSAATNTGAAAAASKDLVWVLDTDTRITGAFQDSIPVAKVLGLDGKIQIVDYADKDAQGNAITINSGDLCNYTVKDGVWTLSQATADSTGYTAAVASDYYNGTNKKMNGGTLIADDAVVVIAYKTGATANDTTVAYGDTNKALKDTTKFATITGAQLKKWTDANYGVSASTKGFTEKVNGIEYVKVLFLAWGKDQTGSGSGATTNYGWVTSSSAVEYVAEDGYYKNFKVWNGTAELELKLYAANSTAAAALPALAKGSLITFSDPDEDNITTVNTSLVVKTGAIAGYSAADKVINIIEADGTTSTVNAVTDDTKYLYVDTAKNTGVSSSGLPLATVNADGSYTMNIKYVASTATGHTAEAAIIVVDTNNAVKGAVDVHVGATEIGTAAQSLTKAFVAAQADGMYTPVAGTGTNNSEFTGRYGDFDKLIFFKFQGTKDKSYTLEIKKTDGTEVYTESISARTANGPVVTWVDTMASADAATNWKTADLATGGTFIYTIKTTDTTPVTVLAGSFTITR